MALLPQEFQDSFVDMSCTTGKQSKSCDKGEQTERRYG